MKRGRLDLTFICSTCKRLLIGWLEFDNNNQIADSDGFLMFDRPMCDSCLALGDEIGEMGHEAPA